MNTRFGATLVAFVVVACGGDTSTPQPSDGGAGTGGGGASGAGGGSGAGGASGSGGTAGAGGGSTCTPACGTARDCCAGHCANLQNDPLNCGLCGKKCNSGTYCSGGQCVTTPCQTTCGGSGQCCGTACCATGELCCDTQGPIPAPGPVCTTPINGTCPMGCAPLCVCASPETPIATPAGNKPIASLNVGDLVYSVDHGQMTIVPIVRTNRTPVSGHSVVRVVLEGGTTLEISPLHPTADGRDFGALRSGHQLDGVRIVSATTIPYSHDATYDILPESDSGAYFAGGVLVGSTLARNAARVDHPTRPLETADIGFRR